MLVASLLAAAPAFADLTGQAEAGLVLASGNTEAETANLKLALINELDDWKYKLGGSYLYASDRIDTTAERWEATGESQYSFNANLFWFSAGRYEHDRFSGFSYQASLSSGVGRNFIDTPRTQFSGTAGVGYKFTETRPAFDEAGVLIAPAEVDSEGIFRGTLDLQHELTLTTQLINRLTVEAGADNTFVQNNFAVQVKMTDVLALAAGYSVRHNTDPPVGFDKTDRLTTLSIVYELK